MLDCKDGACLLRTQAAALWPGVHVKSNKLLVPRQIHWKGDLDSQLFVNFDLVVEGREMEVLERRVHRVLVF